MAIAFPLLGAFLALSIGAIVKRALVALGIGTITYVGLQAAFDAVVTAITANYGAMAGASAQLADLAGVGAALGILLGAISARIGISIVSTFTRIL